MIIAQALEAERIDAAVLDPALAGGSASKGFTQLVDLAETNARFPGLGLGVTRDYLEQQSATIEKLVTALTEGLVFVQLPANKPVVVKILMKQLRLNDAQAAEEGYQDHLLTLNRKPYPSFAGLRARNGSWRNRIRKSPRSRSRNWSTRASCASSMKAALSTGFTRRNASARPARLGFRAGVG